MRAKGDVVWRENYERHAFETDAIHVGPEVLGPDDILVLCQCEIGGFPKAQDARTTDGARRVAPRLRVQESG